MRLCWLALLQISLCIYTVFDHNLIWLVVLLLSSCCMFAVSHNYIHATRVFTLYFIHDYTLHHLNILFLFIVSAVLKAA